MEEGKKENEEKEKVKKKAVLENRSKMRGLKKGRKGISEKTNRNR
jgi:hypothetical protein